MAAGRPPEYTEEHVALAEEYLAECEETYEVKERPCVVDTLIGTEHYVVYNPKIPTIEGLAVWLRIHKDTIYDWADKYPEFSDVIGALRHKQADRLINRGLSGDYNSTIAKVLLTKHGYREGIEATGKDGEKLFDDKEAKEKGKAAIGALLGGGDTR